MRGEAAGDGGLIHEPGETLEGEEPHECHPGRSRDGTERRKPARS
jgi:hypothetical protein